MAKNEIDREKSFYRKDQPLEFDFGGMPLKADLDSLNSSPMNKCVVNDSVINEKIRRERNYYKLVYYSNINLNEQDVFTVLGYYDLYYDLWLVSMRQDSVVDVSIIASLSGDDSITEEIMTKLSEGRIVFEKTYVKKQRLFSTPDTVKVIEGNKSVLSINNLGQIEEKVIYELKKDSIVIENN